MNRRLTIAFAALISISASACSSSTKPAAERVAPGTTIFGDPIEQIVLQHAAGPAGEGKAVDATTSLAETTLPETTPPEAVLTVEASPSTTPVVTPITERQTVPTVPITAPVPIAVVTQPIPATVPTVPVTRVIAVAKPKPKSKPKRRPTATTTAPAAVAVAATTEAVPQTTQTPPPTEPPLPPVPTAKVRVAGSPCRPAQKGETAPTKKRQVVACEKIGGKWKWRLIPVATAAPVVAATSPAIVPGFDGKTISLAIIGTSTNPTWSNISRAITAAFAARVATINRRGGIGGKYPIRLIVRDANYDPALTLTELNATKDQVVGFGSILGTPSTERVLETLKQDQLLASPASQEARWGLETNLLPIFNSYQVQAINAVSYYLEQTPRATVCSVSVAGSFGDAGREGFNFAAQDLGAKVGTTLTMAPTDTNPAPILGQLKAAGCQGVMVTVTPIQLLNLVMGSARAGIPFRWLSMGASFSDRLITSQTSLVFEQTVWVVGDGPVWGEGTTQLAAELVAADQKYWTENPDIGLTFGFAQAKVWEAVLERAVVRNDLSRAGLLAAAREVPSVDLGGIGSSTDYSAAQRLSAPQASMFAVDGSYRNSLRMLAPNYASPSAARFKVNATK